jgi:predicted pyridoxine 5'-phosphate oxidase superfamily flavin-nucleotide-binding protein
MYRIDTVEALERVNGATPPQMHLKVIDHLDGGALRWLAHSPLAIVGIGGAQGMSISLAGGAPGFAGGTAKRLAVPLAACDAPESIAIGARFGSLFLIPGIGETLRINGVVRTMDTGEAGIVVEEVYGHCAKALIRSEFWKPGNGIAAPAGTAEFVAASRFLALATGNAQGQADVSPKGDPAGRMAWLDEQRLWFADRPGNRRVDSFRNIIERDQVAITLFVPGSNIVARMAGRAMLTTDEAIRQRFEVQGKLPRLAVGIELRGIELGESRALARARLWPVRSTPDIDPARLFLDHVRANRDGGAAAAVSRSLLRIPGVEGLFRKGLAKDYRDNLY